MKTTMKMLILVLIIGLASKVLADSSVNSLVADVKKPLVSEARVSNCRSSIWHWVKMGSNIKPSGICRVINYYARDGVFLGATSIPLDTSFKVEWYPEVR